MGPALETRSAVIVEDCDELRYIMVRLLQRRGFQIHAYDSALAALDGWRTHGATNLVVTDLTLPRMSGIQLIEQLQQAGQLNATGVLMVTAAAGATLPLTNAVIVSKPFEIAQFEAGVRRALERAQPRAGAA